MTITYLSTPLHDTYGGGEKFIESLLDGMPNQEHIFIGQHPSLQEVFEKRDLKTEKGFGGFEPVTAKNLLLSPLSFILGLIHYLKFKPILKQSDLLVLALSFSEMVFVAPWIHWLQKKPMVFCIRNNRCPKIYKTPLVFILKFLWNRYPSVFISQAQFDEFKANGMIGSQSMIIQNAIPTQPFQPLKKDDIATLKVGFISRLHKEKGLETLLEALTQIQKNLPIELAVAGEGPDREYFRELAKNTSLKENVSIKWLGFLDRPKKFYESVDLVIFPSQRESFGKVLTEAWERGVPVICSNIPVFLEIKSYASAEEQELIFSKNDSASLANKIDYFVKNRAKYTSTQYQNNLHNLVETNFSEEKMIVKYRKLFEEYFHGD